MTRSRFGSSSALAALLCTGLAGTLVGQAGATAAELAEKAWSLRREHAAALVEIGRKCAASDVIYPATAIARTDAILLDRAIGGRLEFGRRPAKPGQRGDNWITIMQVIEGIRDGLVLDPATVAGIAKLDPLLAELAVAQSAAAADLKEVVAGYRALGEHAAAFELAELAYLLHRHTIRDEYRELSDLVAAQRYETAAKACMEEFRRRHEKLGKSKGWKLKGMVIRAPKPNARDAAIISRAKKSGDFELEVDAQFAELRGKIVLVAAWLDSQNYCGLEYDRGDYPVLSLIHVEDGERKMLAFVMRPRSTFDEFFTLRLAVAGNRISTDLSIEPCQAELPAAFREGARYGLLRPGFGQEPSKQEARQAITLRNLVVK